MWLALVLSLAPVHAADCIDMTGAWTGTGSVPTSAGPAATTVSVRIPSQSDCSWKGTITFGGKAIKKHLGGPVPMSISGVISSDGQVTAEIQGALPSGQQVGLKSTGSVAAASTESTAEPAGDKESVNIETLQRDVLSYVMHELERTRDRNLEDPDGRSIWW